MPKFLMVVSSAAKEGREEEYNAWYDSQHLNDLLAIPGVIGGRRYDAVPMSPNPQPHPFLAIYEIEADDPGIVLAELMRRSQAGEMTMSDAVDGENAKIWMYKPH